MSYDPVPTLEPTGEFLRRRGLAYRDLRILVAGTTPAVISAGTIEQTFRLDIQPDRELACALLQKEKQAVVLVALDADPIPGLELLERLGEVHPGCIKVALLSTHSTEMFFPAVQRGVIDILLGADASEAEIELVLASAVERSTRERASAGLLNDVSTEREELARRIETTTQALFEANERLDRMNAADASTGLYGMTYFQHTWRREMTRSTRYGRPLSLMVMDLDHSVDAPKLSNDTLRATGTFLLESIRDVDFVARFRSEGFCIILPECGKSDALELAQRLCTAFANNDSAPGLSNLTLSIAVVSCPEDESSAAAMIQTADAALRAAMASGSNQVVPA
jgi:diguanylate cyclase (GGDEF)-like protein